MIEGNVVIAVVATLALTLSRFKTLSKAKCYLVPELFHLKTLTKAKRYLVPERNNIKTLSKAKRYLIQTNSLTGQ